MKTYRFTGVRTIEESFVIDVDAESYEEAQKLVDEGDFDEYGHSQSYMDGSEEIDFEGEVEEDDSDEDDDESEEDEE